MSFTTINQLQPLQKPEVVARVVIGEIPQLPAHFISRDELSQVRKVLSQSRIAVVVTGMRGVGKSQLAAAIARDEIDRGAGLVAWINAEALDSTRAGLSHLAERFGIADPDGDSAKSAQCLRDYLSSRSQHGLLVLDNAADPDLIRPLLPTAGGTKVLITSVLRLKFVQFIPGCVGGGVGSVRGDGATEVRIGAQ
ncbi:NB-ARC domain-containing protein [Nocardia sp. CA-128927]|uniref:NB-ARC domain-containing protein n=1 Tax=Nocardia sp. CA-128927 TaxID=3239975 RepID=UPI003D964709